MQRRQCSAQRVIARETFIIIQENLVFEQVLQRIVIKLLLSVTIAIFPITYTSLIFKAVDRCRNTSFPVHK